MNPAPGSCQKQCYYQYRGDAQKANCNSATQCTWNDATVSCKNRCDYVKTVYTDVKEQQGACKADALCFWKADTNTCTDKCNNKYGKDSVGCDADSLCMWDRTNAQCKETCTAIDKTTCDAETTMCVYRVGSPQPCNKKCQYRYKDKYTCDGDRECMWDASGVCKESCAVKANTDCNSDSMCEVRQSTCVKKCEIMNNTGCGLDSACEIINNTCYKRCDLRFTDPKLCNADPVCMWDGTSLCKKTCAVLSTAQCSKDSQCEANAPTCDKICQFRYTAQDDCNLDYKCMWDVDLKKCSKNCAEFSSKIDCRHSNCEWHNNTCQQTCFYRNKD
eukprot:PhF_6_TR40708/c0_g1_i1/m.61207